MKKSRVPGKYPKIDPDDILPEYDFSKARPNKYASRYKKGALVVTVAPEVARVFPAAEDVNQTLRSLESGEDYLYPKECFSPVQLEERAVRALKSDVTLTNAR